MGRCRSLTTLSLIVAIAIGAAALLAQPANASGRSEAGFLALARFESPMERIQRWFALAPRGSVQPQEGATIVPGGKEGATIVPGGKEGATIVPGGGITTPSPSRGQATGDLDRNY